MAQPFQASCDKNSAMMSPENGGCRSLKFAAKMLIPNEMVGIFSARGLFKEICARINSSSPDCAGQPQLTSYQFMA
ncbi:MAG TPA: hypothetical protein PLB32_09930 [Acidobacteriota bacterium]|nr:hypothetical protein [Acidobacteriota bacterium]